MSCYSEPDVRRLKEASTVLRAIVKQEYEHLGDELEKGSTATTLRRWTTLGRAMAAYDEALQELSCSEATTVRARESSG